MKTIKEITDLKIKLKDQEQVNNNLKNKSYSFFNFFNVATILATGILFFNVGRKNNTNLIKELNGSADNMEINFFEEDNTEFNFYEEDNIARAIPGW